MLVTATLLLCVIHFQRLYRHLFLFHIFFSNMEASENPRVLKRRHRPDNFKTDFGDLTPISEFKGPKVPSNRQVVKMFLNFHQPPAVTKKKAAKTTVLIVLAQHSSKTGRKEASRTA